MIWIFLLGISAGCLVIALASLFLFEGTTKMLWLTLPAIAIFYGLVLLSCTQIHSASHPQHVVHLHCPSGDKCIISTGG